MQSKIQNPKSKISYCLLPAACCLLNMASAAAAEEPNEAMLEALRPFHAVVGGWKGTGTSQVSSGWAESIDCQWGFRERDGRVALEWHLSGGELFEAALISFDPEPKLYQFVARSKGGERIKFAGKPAGAQSLRLFRIDKSDTKDRLDRIDISLARGGDKLVYRLSAKRGKSNYETYAQVELFRTGAPLADFADGPRCIVTGGAGRLVVEYQGSEYHLACPGAAEEFLRRPQIYIARQKVAEQK